MNRFRKASIKDKIRGCIIGQCLGDALGYPVEGQDEVKCRYYVSNYMKAWFDGKQPDKSEWLGQYTDDSQLARELLESLIENNGWSPDDYANRIAKIFREDKIVGRGIACDQAATRLNCGINWKQSGVPAPSAGNGTAMRAAPAGLFYYDKPYEMIRVAHEQGWITHHDPRCSAGSIAIAGAVALTLKGESDDTDKFTGILSERMSDYHSEFAELVRKLADWISLTPADAAKIISRAGKPDEYVEGWPGISPFVIPSVLWSLYSFLKYPDNYWKAVSTSIAVGGDVDTTAAMTGAISGAYLGIDALPKNLTEMINDHGEWTYSEIIDLTDSCYQNLINNKIEL